MRHFLLPFLAVLLLVATCGCIAETAVPAGTQAATATAYPTVSVVYDNDDLDSGQAAADMESTISLNGNSISFKGSGVSVDGTTATISSAGTYRIRGTLNDGQIVVSAGDEDKVKLVLDGASITNGSGAPIYIISADKTIITLAEGTENFVTDGKSYIFDEAGADEPDAAIFSKDDLTINGDGSLTVTAQYNHGIVSRDDLKITGGHITVTAPGDGIRGKDSVAVKDGTITIDAGGDGIQSSNDEDPEKGYVSIEGGALTITAGEDGIQAETSLSVTGGSLDITTGNGSSTTSTTNTDLGGRHAMTNTATITDTSTKALKANGPVTITGGTMTIDSADDAIHSDDSIRIDSGTITAATGDDGVHANSTLVINGGTITITKSCEGLEAKVITINDGTIHVTASDDGINAADGSGGLMMQGGARPGQFATATTVSSISLTINGGYIYVDANGDGIDVNGPITMTAGTVIVNGPASNGNGALDYDGTFTMNGGYLVAAGSSGMVMAPGSSSSQYSVMVNFDTTQPAGTMVHIESDTGEDLLTFVPTKTYQSVVLNSPELAKGMTCSVKTGGSSTGTVKDGLYTGGTYSGGTLVTTLSISGVVTTSGSTAAMGMGGNMGGGRAAPPAGGGMQPGTAQGERPARMTR